METLSYPSITRCLSGISWVRQVVYLASTGSTNDVAHDLASQNAAEATLIVTNEQSAGRGRMGRTWWAPAGTCLLMSLLLRPKLSPMQALRLTMIAGLAAAEAIEQNAPLPVRLKWPNDIWINGKKAGGILTETRLTGQDLDYAVVGLGLNINLALDTHAELANQATSLMQETGQAFDRLAILHALVERFAAWYAGINTRPVKETWAGRLVTLGQPVSVRTGSQAIEGLAESVDDYGALQVRTPDGQLHTLLAGDVSLRRSV